MLRIVLATRNKNKLREFREIFSDLDIEIVDLEGINVEIIEDGDTFAENSLVKARKIWNTLNTPVLADDSGICVDALGGMPGVYSARYAGEGATDLQNLNKLLEELGDSTNRRAKFVCAITLISDGEEFTVEGVCEGDLVSEARGESGFGYDPIFVPKGYDRTLAQLGAEVKNKISHRSKALEGIKDRVIDILMRGNNDTSD